MPVIAVFFFDGDRIVHERVSFDAAGLVNRIGQGVLQATGSTAGGPHGVPGA